MVRSTIHFKYLIHLPLIMDLKDLKELGLSEGQIAVYLAVLELGIATLSKIQEKTSIERRNIYDILNKLIERGFLTYTIEERTRNYKCTHPNKIKEEIEKKKQILLELEKQIPKITSYFESIKPGVNVQVFRGNESIKSLLNETLEHDSTYWIGSVSGIEQTGIKLWFKNWMRRAIEQKKPIYVLNDYGTTLEDSDGLKYEHFNLPISIRHFMSILIFGNKVAHIMWDKQSFAFVLESKEVKESYMSYFNYFWNQAKSKKYKSSTDSIKVGVLCSLTGTMAISESSIVDAVLMAVDEINKKGGVLGRKIEPIVVDGRSDWPTFAREAKKLITQKEVCSVFGGWTSASRKRMKPVFEKYNNLLWYPIQYEGLEQSKNIIYLGAAPNQQIIPAIEWVYKKLGKKFFLMGSDYVFSHAANEIIKAEAKRLRAKIAAEEYVSFAEKDFEEIIDKIKESKSDVILNTINGDSNIAFFRQLRKEGITPSKIPTLSFSIAEDEIRQLNAKLMVGDYAAWNYFQSIDSSKNKLFVKNFINRYGMHRVTSDPMEAAYLGVYLFKSAVEKAGNTNPEDICKAAKGLKFNAPEGIVQIDPKTHHLKKTARIGRVLENGQFKIVWSSKISITPEPYPKSKSVQEWDDFLKKLYNGWGEKWSG